MILCADCGIESVKNFSKRHYNKDKYMSKLQIVKSAEFLFRYIGMYLLYIIVPVRMLAI